MKTRLQALAARINALSLRERVFLFLSIVACCLALADVVWLSPAQLTHKQLLQRFEKQSEDLQRARAELTVLAKPAEGSKLVQDEGAAAASQLESVNQKIKNLLPATEDVTPLAQVLVHFLRRHDGLTLVRTSVVATQSAAASAAQTAAKAAAVRLTRQGVELAVSGPYPELMRYVATLEAALPHVRWGAMTLKSEKLPPELTLQLFVVGMQP